MDRNYWYTIIGIRKRWKEISMVVGYASCSETSKTYSVKLYGVNKIHYSIGELTKFKYRSSNSFLSSKYDSDISNLLFNSLMLNSESISDWLPTSGFDYSDLGNSSNYSVHQKYTQPKEIHLFNNDEYKIYFYFRASAGHKERRTSHIREQVFLNVESAEYFHPKELYKLKAIIERLFSIILFEPFISTITEIRKDNGSTYRNIAKIKQTWGDSNVTVDFETFRQNSQSIFNRWFEKQEKFDLFIKNFFSVYGQNGVLLENRFLTYISILENYHKNNVKRSAILKERLSFILENSCLKDRNIDLDKYSEKLKVTRNYHAHLEEKHEKKSLNLKGIDHSNRLLEIIIREIMLRELNIVNTISQESINELIIEINKTIE